MSWERSIRNRGFTLLEILVSLATIGVLMGAYLGLNASTRSAKLAAIVKQVNSIREAADKYIEATGGVDYTSLWAGQITALINAGYLPPSINSASSNPLGVTYSINDDANTTKLRILIYNLPDWARAPVANRLSTFSSATPIYPDGRVEVIF